MSTFELHISLQRLPDLTPLDFLRGHLKTIVYAVPPINLQNLKY